MNIPGIAFLPNKSVDQYTSIPVLYDTTGDSNDGDAEIGDIDYDEYYHTYEYVNFMLPLQLPDECEIVYFKGYGSVFHTAPDSGLTIQIQLRRMRLDGANNKLMGSATYPTTDWNGRAYINNRDFAYFLMIKNCSKPDMDLAHFKLKYITKEKLR